MLNQEMVDHREELIRERIQELPDEKRRQFYEMARKRIKDPDTYAVLNYLFIAGLHHFYLGKWIRGLINLTVFIAGLCMVLGGALKTGLLFVAGISLVELYALFFSQLIVKDYNNQVQEEILKECTPHAPSSSP